MKIYTKLWIIKFIILCNMTKIIWSNRRIIIIIVTHWCARVSHNRYYGYSICDAVQLRSSSYAHPTSTDVRANHILLQRLSLWTGELFLDVDGGQPETQLVGKVMARSPCSVTLDEWCGSEVFQARARAGQRLTASFSTSSGVLYTYNTDLMVSNIRTIQP